MTKFPTLLIPGNMCDDRLWAPVASELHQAGYPVRHAPRLDQPTIEAMAQAVLDATDGPFVAVGFSMGAIVAAELARSEPERIRAIGLVAFNASSDLPERAAVRPRQQAAVRSGQLEAIVAEELKPNYLAAQNRSNPHLLKTVMEMARAVGSDAFLAQSEALRLRRDLRPALGGFSMPVLLACGSEDRLCPLDWHRDWADLIGDNASVVEVPGAGHLLPLEQPHALTDALIGWLTKDVQCPTAS